MYAYVLNLGYMDKDNKVVYIHRKSTDDTIFYVGIGKPSRANSRRNRNSLWMNTVKKHGYYSEVLLEGLEWDDACEIETYLIGQLGRRDLRKGALVNQTNGGEGRPSREVQYDDSPYHTKEQLRDMAALYHPRGNTI